mgnify:FL=1
MAGTSVFKEEEIKSKFSIAVWAKTFKYVFVKWPLLIVLFIGMMFTSFYDASFIPSMNAGLISAFDSGQLVGYNSIFDVILNVKILGIDLSLTFLNYIIFYIIMIVLRSISIFLTFFTMSYFEMIIMTGLRRDAYKRIQELSFSYFDRTPSGWLIARLQNDAANIGDVLSNSVLRIFWIAVELIFTLITMFSYSWLLSLIILATTPLIFFIVLIFQRIILKLSRIARTAYSEFVRWLAESISGNKTIKSLAIEDTIYKECDEIATDVCKKRFKTGKVNAFFNPSINVLSAITTAIIIVVFPMINISNETTSTIAMMVLFLGFVGSIFNPIAQFAEIFAELISTQANVEKLFMLIDTKPELVDSSEVIKKYGSLFDNKTENFEQMKGDITFDHVSFSYKKDLEVLHDMNIHINAGNSIAIVGETGSGKSTTVNLLCRFYEPTKGQILIDGVNYKDRSVGWLRSNIGYVQQTPFIFKGTIKDNIKYGKLDATDEEVITAAKVVDLHDFILSLKDGYNTFLKDGGDELSQGQKQLISFARAIIRNPKLLILDEATSSIDTETEHVIQEAIAKVLKGRTSIMIAHRLSTIVDCDRILVMKDGKVIEDVNHKVLMEKHGYYYELYMNQFKDLNLEAQIKTFDEQITGKNVNL